MVKRKRNYCHCWGDQLNDDVAVEIAKKIKLYEDFTAFRGVCSLWRSAIVIQDHFRFMSTQIPMLLLPATKTSTTCDFFSLSRNMSRQIELPEIHNKKYFSSKGWLITISKYLRISMLHPFTRCRLHIKLPPIHAFKYWKLELPLASTRMVYAYDFIHKCVLSSNPSSTSDYTVMVIFGYIEKLGFARSGDKAWTTIDTWTAPYSDVTYYKGMFYATNDLYEIMACDVRGDDPTIAQEVTQMPSDLQKHGCGGKLYILESAGALLVVERKRVDSYIFHFRVFELDVSTNITGWREIKSLGNRALFLCKSCSLSIETTHTASHYCRPNCIYFIKDDAEHPGFIHFPKRQGRAKYMGVYDMQSGRVEPYFCSDDSHDSLNPLMWVEQSF
ncbi:hypothetical protein Dsin_020720 [Dipteronia sinensis]|uniref:KIB1-4 beta-propeller domain-containing protein n=1 Tax=Dipteronia sinensis TaxID=43782 RepID=A0AAE0AAJ9_9ROSI|nr:hypothetical protein Dsin_020720 [Dipteronia sinensis]